MGTQPDRCMVIEPRDWSVPTRQENGLQALGIQLSTWVQAQGLASVIAWLLSVSLGWELLVLRALVYY